MTADFGSWIEQHGALLRHIARGVGVPDDEVDDAVQEGTLQLWRAWEDFDPAHESGGTLRGWACRVVEHQALTYRRVRVRRHQLIARALTGELASEDQAVLGTGRIRELVELRATAGDPPDDQVIARLELEAVLPALTWQQRCVMARLAEGLGYDEIAGELGLSRRQVKTAIQCARERAWQVRLGLRSTRAARAALLARSQQEGAFRGRAVSPGGFQRGSEIAVSAARRSRGQGARRSGPPASAGAPAAPSSAWS